MRKVVAICGAEPFYKKDGTIKHFSDTFLNNILTWKHDNPTDKVVIIDARSFLKSSAPLSDLWKKVCSAHDEIDILIYSGHSSPTALLIYSRCRTELPEEQRFLTTACAFKAPFSENAIIYLNGCQAGGKEGKKWTDSVAQVMANKTGKTVYAFVYKSSQKRRDDGYYYQKPDKLGLVKFIPEATHETALQGNENPV